MDLKDINTSYPAYLSLKKPVNELVGVFKKTERERERERDRQVSGGS